MLSSWRTLLPQSRLVALSLALVIFVALLLRAKNIDATYVLDAHAWRQTDSAAFTHGYLVDSFNPFDPSIDRYPCDAKHAKFGRVEAELPLYAWLPAVPLKILGVDHVPLTYLRSWYLAYFVISCLFLFALVRELGGDELDATLTVSVFSFLPVSIFFTRTIQPDGPSLLFAAAFLLFLSRVSRNTRGKLVLLAAALSGALLLLTKVSNAYVALPGLYLVLTRMGWKRALRDIGLWLVLAGILIPNIAWYAHAHGFGWTFGIWGDGVDNKFSNQGLLLSTKTWKDLLSRLCWDLLTAGGFALAMIGLGVNSESLRQRIATVWLGACLLFIVATLNGQMRHVYYQLSLVLPVAILAAAGIRALWTRGSLTRWVLAACLVVHGATTYTALYAPSNSERFFAENQTFSDALRALTEHVPEDSYFVSSTRDPRLYFNSGRRGYFGKTDWTLLSACMAGTSEWLLLDQAAAKRLNSSVAFKASMHKVWSGKHYSLWRKGMKRRAE